MEAVPAELLGVSGQQLLDAPDRQRLAPRGMGRVFPLAGQGMPRLQGGGRGDLFATARVVLPTGLSDRQRDLVRELAGQSAS